MEGVLEDATLRTNCGFSAFFKCQCQEAECFTGGSSVCCGRFGQGSDIWSWQRAGSVRVPFPLFACIHSSSMAAPPRKPVT